VAYRRRLRIVGRRRGCIDRVPNRVCAHASRDAELRTSHDGGTTPDLWGPVAVERQTSTPLNTSGGRQRLQAFLTCAAVARYAVTKWHEWRDSTRAVQQPAAQHLILLFLSVVINYIDRGNLSVAAPKLSVELAIMPQQLGVLHSMFFLTYALFQIPADGWWTVTT
jgi:hypothetical protein